MPNPASFGTQANALLRKNLTYQKRNVKANIRLVAFPAIVFVLLFILKIGMSYDVLSQEKRLECNWCECGGKRRSPGHCPASQKLCGPRYTPGDPDEAAVKCAIPKPPEWPPLLQLPSNRGRAVQTSFIPFSDLPDRSCRDNGSCPVTMLFTGNNQPFAEILSANMFPSASSINGTDTKASLARIVLGTEQRIRGTEIFADFAFSSISNPPIYYLQQDQCTESSSISFDLNMGESNLTTLDREIRCAQALSLWRKSSSDINDELYKGFVRGNKERQANEIVAAFDFLNSDKNIFNVSIWYNASYSNEGTSLTRTPRSINMISNAYLQFLLGPGTKMLFEFVKEMPRSKTVTIPDISSSGGPFLMFFTWIILQLFPVILTLLVYEKQQRIRIMMKMHGLGDGPYWMISYGYFLAISMAYMLCFVIFGSGVGAKLFKANDYSIQFVFYFVYINLQIAMAFLGASIFSNVKTATVSAYIVVFSSGLLGSFLFQFLMQDETFARGWIIFMELYPGFSLYRGLYEFAEYAKSGNSSGDSGMRWKDLNDSTNGMKEVLIIMFVEWIVGLSAAYYLDQVFSGNGRSPLFFLKGFQKKSPMSFHKLSMQRQGSKVLAQTEKSDVIQEKEKVEQLLLEPAINHAIVCDNLKKVYPGTDGNPDKFAVRGLFLDVPEGECLGMLGPNGAGKTSFISMMIGLTKPSSGTAYVNGLDIRTQMNEIYTNIGVCPQHDLLWESLTGREHLLFYGRLKNLEGSVLTEAVEESLKSLNLFHGGVADKQAGQYSGGMKRRLSVAISLIGNPSVVYMDEPSTGLDPASRERLWSVIKTAKKGRAIVLTTHSMEEAEALCDRLGIFVNGSLRCIGNSKELKARYGGTYVFTMATSPEHEKDVENMVRQLSPNANKIYHLSGTQKFELPKEDVRIADVFEAVDFAKKKFTVSAWGLADTTMEDVFIKVAGGVQAFENLS